MAENKKSFVLYSDQRSLIDLLSDEQAGKLLKHIFAYVNDENPITDDKLMLVAFEPIKQQLKRDLVRWENTKESRSKAGKASAESRKQQSLTNSTYVNSVQQTSTNSTVNVNDNVNDNVNVINKVYAHEIINANPEINYEGIRKALNTTLQTNHLPYNKNVQLQITQLFKNGVTIEDMKRVAYHTKNDEWHKKNKYTSCSPPVFFTQEHFDRYNRPIEQPKEKFKIDPLTW
jgi:hypothetical protein